MNDSDAWRSAANCRGIPTGLFYAEGRGHEYPPEVVAACRGCAVIAECLEDALRFPEDADQGYRAGLNARQRRTIRERRRRNVA